MSRKKFLFLLVFLLAFSIPLIGCSQTPSASKVTTTTSTLPTNNASTNSKSVAFTHPQKDFRVFLIGNPNVKTDPAEKSLQSKYAGFASPFNSAVLIGPRYSIAVQEKFVFEKNINNFIDKIKQNPKNAFQEVSFSGMKGFKYNLDIRSGHSSGNAYPVVILPYEERSVGTATLQISMFTNEQVNLEEKFAKKELQYNDPALQKASEDSRRLWDDPEVQAILKSMVVDLKK